MSSKTLGQEQETRQEQGFEVYVLRNAALEVGAVPQLGARILSLKNRRTGREWLWHPEGGLKLFGNCLGDDFSLSTLAGIDECLPTIAPCLWQGRHLPDHGEVWSVPWEVDAAAWQEGRLRTAVQLAISPLAFERTLELRDNELRLSYRLTNQSAQPEHYIWALHPLLRLEPGDQLELPTETRARLNGEGWLSAVSSAVPPGGCAKLFAGPLLQGRAGLVNLRSGDRLVFEWDHAINDLLGLWLTRGGWHGHHHFALEPTNGAPDPLALAAEAKRCGQVPPHGSVSWQVSLRLEPVGS